jgi:hypothetical protein
MNRLHSIRYGFEDPAHYGLSNELKETLPDTRNTRSQLLSNAVHITSSLFPSLADIWPLLRKRLDLAEDVECFVVPEPQMQAYCFFHESHGEKPSSDRDAGYTVVISSGLIERLNTQEIMAVVGHEIGHFLFEHWRHPSDLEDSTKGQILAMRQLERAAEISADRVSMIAADSMNDACTAMIKVASGLGAPYLNPDIRGFLRQFRKLTDNRGHYDSIWSSHPMIPLRVRAMLRFDPIRKSLSQGDRISNELLGKVDEKINQDFHKATDFALEKIANKNIEDVRLWSMVSIFVADGILSKNEQCMMRNALGDETTNKVINFLKSSSSDMRQAVASRLQESCDQAKNAPLSEREKLINELDRIISTFANDGEYNTDAESNELVKLSYTLGVKSEKGQKRVSPWIVD